MTDSNSDERYWLVNKMPNTTHSLEMILCKIKYGQIEENDESGKIIHGENCVIIKMSDKYCSAYVLNIKDLMTFGYLKSYVWNGVKNNSLKKLTFKIENVNERVFYFKKEQKIRAI